MKEKAKEIGKQALKYFGIGVSLGLGLEVGWEISNYFGL